MKRLTRVGEGQLRTRNLRKLLEASVALVADRSAMCSTKNCNTWCPTREAKNRKEGKFRRSSWSLSFPLLTPTISAKKIHPTFFQAYPFEICNPNVLSLPVCKPNSFLPPKSPLLEPCHYGSVSVSRTCPI